MMEVARLSLVLSMAAALACSPESTHPTVATPPPATTATPAARGAVHRLNAIEYNATVGDVLGTKLEPATAGWREGELLGFDNMAEVLGVDEPLYGHYFAAAAALAADVIDAPSLRSRFVECDLRSPECAQQSVRRAGLRLFRRPLTEQELQIYFGLYAGALEAGDPPLGAFELVLQALLASAQFVYRLELDAPAAAAPRDLGAFDLATRLSYFLWSSAPDDELLQAAADGSLLTDAKLGASVDRLLADPKASRFVESFAGQWLGARRVASHAAVPELYDWTPLVARAAGEEIVHFFGEFLLSDRSWLDFPKADVNYVTEPLARYYGIPTPEVALARVEQHPDGRAGFFGLAGFLALSSFDRRTSPSLRGRWISSTLLCAEPAPPPNGVPQLEVSAGDGPSTLNVRQTLELHRQNPGCAVCHAAFDPYGLALEEYDAIGRYRTTYADGTAVDASATLPPSEAHPDGLTFTGLAGLSDVVAADPRFGACLSQKLLMYGLGRRLESGDHPSLAHAFERWRAPGEVPSLRRLIRELVLSDAFRSRLPEVMP